MNERIFITGVSALTPTGHTALETWQAAMEGRCGLAEIKQFDIASWDCRLGGELKEFNPARSLPDRKLLKVMSKHDTYGLFAALEAVNASGLIDYRNTLSDTVQFNERTGVFVASPGNKYFQQYDFLNVAKDAQSNMQQFATLALSDVHPMWLLRILPNNVLAYTGIHFGFKGANHNITNHAVGGMQALIEAFHSIRSGQSERAVVVAYDFGIEPQALYYYDKIGVLSHRHLKPFDIEHDGTILAEGAVALVLESEASAQARQAHCYAEVKGAKSATEGKSLFSIEEEGSALSQLMRQTLEASDVSPEELGWIMAHGNGNKKSDLSEAHAIESCFGQEMPPITANKWSMGHLLAASGLLDVAMAAVGFEQKCLPGIANLTNPAAECAGLNLKREAIVLDELPPHGMIINRGYASMNTCVVLERCE